MDLIEFIANRIEDAQEKKGLQRIHHDSKLDDNFKALRNYYNPNKGRLSSWWQSRKSDSRSNLIASLNREQKLVIEQAVMLEEAVMAGKRRKAEFQNYIAKHAALFIEIQVHVELVKEAAKRGLNLESHLRVREEELLSKIRINEYLATEGYSRKQELEKQKELDALEHARKVENTKLDSELKLDEYKTKAGSDLENEIKLADAKLKFDMTAKHISRHMKIDLIQDEIEKQYIKISEIRASTTIPQDAKDDMIASRQRIIDKWVKEQDET